MNPARLSAATKGFRIKPRIHTDFHGYLIGSRIGNNLRKTFKEKRKLNLNVSFINGKSVFHPCQSVAENFSQYYSTHTDRHRTYIHYNPVKHNLASCPHLWSHSSFQSWVENTVYPQDWCCVCDGKPNQPPNFTRIADRVGE